MVYNLDSSYKADAIVGKGNNLTDVKGKKVGVEGINSFSHLFVLKSLEKVGLAEGDIEFVNVAAENVKELQKGNIFAGHVYEPFITDALKKGFRILSTAAITPGVITNVLVFHSNVVEQRSYDIQNIIKSLIEAKTDFNDNKEQDISRMSHKSGLTEDKINEGINNVLVLNLNYNSHNSMNKSSNETMSLYKSGNDIAKFYAERGIISEYPNIDDLVDSQFVNALLKEDNITIFQ